MTTAKGAGTVTCTVKTASFDGSNKKTTTVTIDVADGTTGAQKMQALEAALDNAPPKDDKTGGHDVDSTYVANPPHLVVAASNSGTQTVTSVNIDDKGGLQKNRVTSVRQIGEDTAIDSARLVLLGEPTGSNPDGAPSTFWIDSDRGQVSYPIKARDDLESLTAALMLELRVLGFAVTSPTDGVFLFTINELNDGSTFMAGTDDVGLDYSVGMR